MPDINQLLDLSPPIVLVIGLNILMSIIKYSFPEFPRRWIPLLCLTLGTVIFPLVSDNAKVPYSMASPITAEIILGFTLGGCAVGLHQVFINFLKQKFNIQLPGETEVIVKGEEVTIKNTGDNDKNIKITDTGNKS